MVELVKEVSLGLVEIGVRCYLQCMVLLLKLTKSTLELLSLTFYLGRETLDVLKDVVPLLGDILQGLLCGF